MKMSAIVILCACFGGLNRPGARDIHLGATKIGTVLSADRRYSATAALGEAEVIHLTVRHGSRVVLQVSDVRGFTWLPGKPDTLVYATSGLYGKGGLWSWNAARGARPIVRAKRPLDEAFVLDRIDFGHGRPIVVFHHGGAEQPARQLRQESKKLSPNIFG